MSFKKTGYTETTANSYIIDSAVVYKNVTYDDPTSKFTGTLIGATQGGPKINVEQVYRYPEVDGTAHIQGKVKGNAILESAKATATVPLKEINAENLRGGLNATMIDALATEAPAGYKKLTSKRKLEDADYLTNLAFVGFLSGTGNPVIFILDNALSAGSVELQPEDNGEAVVELTYEAHSTVEQLQADEFPWRIFFPAIA